MTPLDSGDRYVATGEISGDGEFPFHVDFDYVKLDVAEEQSFRLSIERLNASNAGAINVHFRGEERSSASVYVSSAHPVDIHLQAGTYYFLVVGGRDSWSGEYRVTATKIDRIDDHVDAAGSDATIVTLPEDRSGWTFSGYTETAADRDVFQFEVDIPTTVIVPDGPSDLQLVSVDGHSPQRSRNQLRLQPGVWNVTVSGSETFFDAAYSRQILRVEGSSFADDHPDFITNRTQYYSLDEQTGLAEIEGTLHEIDDRDIMGFTLSDPANVTLEFDPTAISVTLMDEAGSVIQPSAAGNEYQLRSAGYYLRILSGSDFSTSPYSVLLNAQYIPPVITDVVVSPATSTFEATGTLDHPGQKDFYRLTLNETTNVQIEVTGRNGDDAPMALLAPVDGNSQFIRSGDTMRLGAGSWDFYVIGGYLVSDDLDYALRVTVLETFPDDVDDYPDGPTENPVLAPFDTETSSWTLSGTVNHLNDVDYVAFEVPEDSNIVIKHTPEFGGSYSFQSAAGEFGNSTSPGLNQLSAGVWYLVAFGHGGQYDFDMKVYTVPSTEDHTVNVDTETGRFRFSGFLQHSVDVDEFPITLTQPTTIRIDDTSNRPSLTIRTAASGTPVDLNEDQILPPGDYVIRAQPDNFYGVGPYEFEGSLAAATTANEETQPVADSYMDSVKFISSPQMTLDSTPVFEWEADGSEFEIFIGVPDSNSSEAVFRRRGLPGSKLEVPVELANGKYKAWLRKHAPDGQMSRWGTGFEFEVGGQPEVTFDGPTLSWTAVDNAVRYEVWIDALDENGNRTEKKVVHDTSVTATSITIPDDVMSKQIGAWVRAVAEVDGVERNSYWSAMRQNREPAQIETVTFRTEGQLARNQTAVIEWDEVAGAVEYEVFVGQPGESQALFRRSGLTGTSFEIPESLGAGDHYVWMRAIGSAGQKSRWGRFEKLSILEFPSLEVVPTPLH